MSGRKNLIKYFVENEAFDGEKYVFDDKMFQKGIFGQKKSFRVSKIPLFMLKIIHNYLPDNEEFIIEQGKMKRRLIKETTNYKKTSQCHIYSNTRSGVTDLYIWFNDQNKIHRDGDRPALIANQYWTDNKEMFFKNGKLHRGGKQRNGEMKPAIIDGELHHYYKNGEFIKKSVARTFGRPHLMFGFGP